MGCGCGGNGNGGGCSGGQPRVEIPANAPVVQEVVPDSRPGADEPEADEGEEDEPAPELIASSEQEWPRIKVNGLPIAVEAIAQELQYHPAASRREAVFLAGQALVIRELLQQRAAALGLQVRAAGGESEEEALTRTLIELEVPLPRADEDTCRRYYERNLARFASAPLLAARHILLGCPADDAEARSLARERAEALIAELRGEPGRFAELALAHSACPSKEQGGSLGQISQGQTVPEFERQLLRLPLGLATQPLESRYGFHAVQVDLRIEGRQLPFETVVGAIRAELDQRVWQVAVAQYLKNLVGEADIQGIVLEGADSPLLQ
ncbi:MULTISPECIES: peptidylprolyl isomerase [unclassified Pseudomonas]|uniref:peptidylprolyl isomerase n=1 Tax=unclassified Pseudomonas TaxID=196821 RepID=UPI0024486BBE|nr:MULTISPECIES: peptidylprolyl isomerase [unclassified Pseudomonas]MDH0895317.1 peptidylprolyl isomerase [Pseudomonas sp. GD03875]MDH1064111.1 peptidylprolyl isomerase [Pseudomonas sp. GD03985]